jgi:hypothetical protein
MRRRKNSDWLRIESKVSIKNYQHESQGLSHIYYNIRRKRRAEMFGDDDNTLFVCE